MESKEKTPESPAPSTTEPSWKPEAHEPEHVGSIWKHPYLVYIYLTAVLFGGLVFIAWLAWENGWIPNRSVGSP